MKNQNNILCFEIFQKFPNLVHGFSTRSFGNLRPSRLEYTESLTKFTEALQIDPKEMVTMDQVHSNTVYFTTEKDRGAKIAQTDGLLTSDTKVFLGVITADCVPLLFFNPKKQLVAAIHAGWRGLFSEIIPETVSQFVQKGSDVSEILVGIGPSIRVCCYEVSEDFVERFREKFGDVEKFLVRRSGKVYFNLQNVAKDQLLSAGVIDTNIEDGAYCTFDHTDVFSCRREGKDFGEMMGIIGLQPSKTLLQ